MSNAKKKAKTNPSKQAPKKAVKQSSSAAVGPVKGKLVSKRDKIAIKPTEGLKVGKPVTKEKNDLADLVNKQFDTIVETLVASNEGKQPRQLRWALRSLDAARDAAMRHVQHNV